MSAGGLEHQIQCAQPFAGGRRVGDITIDDYDMHANDISRRRSAKVGAGILWAAGWLSISFQGSRMASDSTKS